MSAKNCEKYSGGKLILAPMVKIGTLPFRLLALRYGADLVYTEEIIDWKILKSKRMVNDILGIIEYVDKSDGTVVFSTCEEEKSRVILQMGTSDANRALKVLQLVQDDVSGVDVNMGCPKEFSLKGGMGAALLKKPEKIKDILTTLVTHAKIPVTCKIRILSTIEKTLELAYLIQSTGVSALAIHGRNVNERPQHPNHNDFIKAIAEKLEIPVIANGGSKEINCFEDIEKFRKSTGSSSVMIARAGEWDPSIFRKTGKVDLQTNIKEYLKLAVETDNPFTHTKYTIQNLLKSLQESPLGQRFLATQVMEEICVIWDLQDFYNAKKSEWKSLRAAKRPLENSEEDSHHDLKKQKVNIPIDSSIIIVPDCVYIRGHYVRHEHLPKSVLFEWSKKQGLPPPKYTTKYEEKRFVSIASIGGKQFMSDLWEKSKKQSEQASALACIRFLKISS